jgi:hypothetical protein
MLKSSGSRHSMSRTYGPRDMISLVIPRIGDNKYKTIKIFTKTTLTKALTTLFFNIAH